MWKHPLKYHETSTKENNNEPKNYINIIVITIITSSSLRKCQQIILNIRETGGDDKKIVLIQHTAIKPLLNASAWYLKNGGRSGHEMEATFSW